MADFNFDASVSSPDLTGVSRGFTSSKEAFAGLFENVGNLGITAIKVADQNNIQNQTQQVEEGVSSILLAAWGEDIRQAALERGININEGAMDVLVNGIMANAVEATTGKETNIGERYGPGGLSFIKDAVSGEKSLMELAFGPAGTVSSDIVGAIFDTTAPVLGALRAGDPNVGNESYPLMQEDILQRLRTISSVNNATKLYIAANYQKFISKNETFQMDADAMDGVLAGIFGVDPRAIGEAYVKLESVKEIKAHKQKKMQDVSKNLKRAADNYKNPEEWNRYMKAAKLDAIEGGLTPQEYMRAQKDAVRGMNTSFVESINESFIRSAPADLQWKRRQELNEQKIDKEAQ